MLIPEGDGQGHLAYAEDRHHEELPGQAEGLGQMLVGVAHHVAADIRRFVIDGDDARGLGRVELRIGAPRHALGDEDRRRAAVVGTVRRDAGHDLADVDIRRTDADAAAAAHAALLAETVLDVDQLVHDAMAHGSGLAAGIMAACVAGEARSLAGVLDAHATARRGRKPLLVELETGAGRTDGRAAGTGDAGGRQLIPEGMMEAAQQGVARIGHIRQGRKGGAALFFQHKLTRFQIGRGHGAEKGRSLRNQGFPSGCGAFHPAGVAVRGEQQIIAAAGKHLGDVQAHGAAADHNNLFHQKIPLFYWFDKDIPHLL